MKGLGSIFPVLASVLVALLAAGGGPARAAEQPDKLWQLQEELFRLHEAGSDGQALPVAKQALALAVQKFGPDSLQASNQSCGVGTAAEAAGDFAEATRQYTECLRVREILSGRDSQLVAAALEYLGHALFKQGRFAEAEARYSREIQIYSDLFGDEENVPPGAHSGLGAVKLARGDYGAALANYRKAVHRLTSRSAERVTDRSFIDSQLKEHRDTFIGLGRTAAALRLKPGADERRLMDESFAAGQRAWATSAASALVKMTARLKASDTELGRSIRHLDELNERIQALSQQNMDAGIAEFKNNPALRQGMEAMSVAGVALMKDMAPFIKGQRELAGVTKRQQELTSRLNGLAKRCPTASGPGCAASDRERIAIKKELSELSTKTSHAMKEQDLDRMQESARLALEQLAAADKTIPGFADAGKVMKSSDDESRRLERELNAAREAVVKRFPEYLSLSDPAPLTVAETQRLLKEDEALVAILTAPESSMVWVVTPAGADWAEIGAGDAALAAEVKALRAGLVPSADGRPAAFDTHRAHALYKLLLGRFDPMLGGARHIMFVPTGPVSSLPFQVLVTEPPQAGLSQAEALKEAQWLIRKAALSVLPSVQSLSSLRKLAASGVAVKPYFGIGDPALGGPAAAPDSARGAAKPAVTLAALYRGGGGAADLPLLQTLSPLPETAGELRRVAHSLGASDDSIIVGQAATKNRLMAVPLQDYRVLHFATHGLVAGELSGLREPALVLSLPPHSAKAEDALLTASEVATMQLNADWTVLSACNTAAGDKAGADALSGLARAFLFAGTRALLVSHWAVDSESAVSLTARTFSFLAKSPQMRRAEAFQRAMLTMIEEGQPPANWAPFVIVGEGGPIVRKGG